MTLHSEYHILFRLIGQPQVTWSLWGSNMGPPGQQVRVRGQRSSAPLRVGGSRRAEDLSGATGAAVIQETVTAGRRQQEGWEHMTPPHPHLVA